MSETMSIVVPVYNRAKELPRTVASLVAQHYRPIHLILVDNNSSDDSLEVCRHLQRKYSADHFTIDVLQEPKQGASAARNCGLRHVNTRHMMFFDSDDTLHPDAVTLYMEAFSIHPDADIIGSTIRFDNGKSPYASFTSSVIQQLLHAILSTQRFAARTDVIRAVGGWEEDYTGWEDWNLGVRLLLHTSKIHWIKRPPLATVYLHENTITEGKDRRSLEQFCTALQYTRNDIVRSQHPQKQRLERFVVYRQVLLAAYIVTVARRGGDAEIEAYGRSIYRAALRDPVTTPWLRAFFTLCFHYALHGGRGMGHIARYVIR